MGKHSGLCHIDLHNEIVTATGRLSAGQAQTAISLAGGSFTAISPKANEKERPCRERPRDSRAAEQRDELAPFHCPMPPVLPTERIAHLSAAGVAALRDFDPAYDRSGS